jgi:ABC-type transporter Mla subunit MlaD
LFRSFDFRTALLFPMEKPFKFRRAREIAGAFVLLAAALLVTGVVMHGQIRGWFQPKELFEVPLPETGTQGLRAGSEVYVLGNKVGSVKRIDLRHRDTGETLSGYTDVTPDKIRLMAILEIQGGMSVFVGKDSKAKLQRDLGGFGSSFFEITRGHEPWPSQKNRELAFETPPEVQDELTATVSEIRENITPALKAIADGANNISKFADKLQSDDGNFQTTLASLNKLVVRIDKGEGALGVLLKDEQAKKDLSETLTNVKNTSTQLDKTITSLATAVDKMEKGEGVLGTLLNDAPAAEDLSEALDGINKAATSLNTSLTAIEGGAKQFPATIAKTDEVVEEIGKAVLILQEALSEIELVAEGLQGHWLVKGSVDDVKEEREKAAKSQQQAAAEAAARASGESPSEPEKKRRGIFFWRK